MEVRSISNVNLAIILYSASGTNYYLTHWASKGATETGAEVKILKVPELVPQFVIDSNPAWKNYVEEVSS
jgi:NAD(P)H dehydrogenase (quinone)